MEIRGNYSRGVLFKGGYELGKYGLRISIKNSNFLNCNVLSVILFYYHSFTLKSVNVIEL